MAVSFRTVGTAQDTSAPYSISLASPTVAGDLVFAVALAAEWNSSTPGARTLLDPAEPGWNRLYIEEFQIYPTAQPLRRMVFGAWWKVATGATTPAVVTLTGGALTGRLRGGIVAVEGVTGGYVGQALTRRENVDLGAGPTPWSPTIPTIAAGQVGFLLYQVWGSTGFPPGATPGWATGPALSSTFGYSGTKYVEGASPPITWPNQNINAMVSIAVFDIEPRSTGPGWLINRTGVGV